MLGEGGLRRRGKEGEEAGSNEVRGRVSDCLWGMAANVRAQ